MGTSEIRPITWADGRVRLIDQTRLPQEEVWLELANYKDVIKAIRDMRIRGAPAIGVAGAYAVALAALEIASEGRKDFMSRLEAAADEIRDARPTGANLGWAVRRMINAARSVDDTAQGVARLVTEAARIQDEDEEANHRMGRFGADLIPYGSAVLTHCNAGALATGGFGTALGIIRTAWADGRLSGVFATETRPLLQGARLTMWELDRAGVDATLIPDSAAGQLMRRSQVHSVVVGADRIAANGDVANKIGTYSLAVLAAENAVSFYVAAPTSTIDLSLESGDLIPIEQRAAEEVADIGGARTAPLGTKALNLAFDVTPHRYVSAIITERGVVKDPYGQGLEEIMGVQGG